MSGFNPFRINIKSTATPPISSGGYITIWASNQDNNLYIVDDKGVNRSLTGEKITKKINKNDHGFSVGQVIGYNGSDYFLAQANNSNNSEAIGIIETVIDQNNFVYVYSGNIYLPNAVFTPGNVYFVSPSIAGGLTNEEPDINGHVSKPVFIALTINTGIVYSMRGDVVTVIDFVNTTENQVISGDKTFYDDISAMGGLRTATKLIDTTTLYTIEERDNNIYCDTSAGDSNINLPFIPLNGRELLFLKTSNDANKIIINGNTRLINGASIINVTGALNKTKVQYLNVHNAWYII
jgi:hypothetical protein